MSTGSRPGVSTAVLWVGEGQGIAMYGATNNARDMPSCEYTCVELVAVAEAARSWPAPADGCGVDDKDGHLRGAQEEHEPRVMA